MNREQVAVLLAGINPRRVAHRDGNSYLPQHDVRAMLTRVFGFAGWSLIQNHDPKLIHRHERQLSSGKEGVAVTYLCSVTIVIHGDPEVRYTGSGTHTAVMGLNAEGDAHDSAVKSADSAALKRAAMNLGDQFGLGLYDGGHTRPLVRKVWHEGRFVTARDFEEPDSEATDAPDPDAAENEPE